MKKELIEDLEQFVAGTLSLSELWPRLDEKRKILSNARGEFSDNQIEKIKCFGYTIDFTSEKFKRPISLIEKIKRWKLSSTGDYHISIEEAKVEATHLIQVLNEKCEMRNI